MIVYERGLVARTTFDIVLDVQLRSWRITESFGKDIFCHPRIISCRANHLLDRLPIETKGSERTRRGGSKWKTGLSTYVAGTQESSALWAMVAISPAMMEAQKQAA